jgi:hypothetical protein
MAARKRKPPGATTRGGWGHNHQRRRAQLAPYVNAGKATCCRCHEPIHPGEEWHLDHDDTDRRVYLGVSHARCNLAAGAHKVNANRTAPRFEERPYKWSQRWYDDPPIGTIVLGHERVIYLGNGEWQPLDDEGSGISPDAN